MRVVRYVAVNYTCRMFLQAVEQNWIAEDFECLLRIIPKS